MTNVLVGIGLLVGTWRFRSYSSAAASALVLSPIVWLDYFALAAIPLAVVRPRFSVIWLVPLLTWGALGTGLGIGDPWNIARVLLIFAIVLGSAFRAERAPDRLAHETWLRQGCARCPRGADT